MSIIRLLRTFGKYTVEIERKGALQNLPDVTILGIDGTIVVLFCFVFFTVDPLTGKTVIVLIETCPTRIDNNKSFQKSLRNDTKLRKNGSVPIPSVVEHMLNSNEIVPWDDRFVVIGIIELLLLSVVLFCLVV